MRKIVVLENLSLDGVMQAPGRPDEDKRGGFQHGGWAMPYNDEVLGREMGKGMAGESELLFGRRTYEDFAGFWPNQQDANPFTEVLNRTPKYVVSKTLHDPLPWQNSTLLPGNAGTSVKKLKAEPGPDLLVMGSGELVQSLMEHELIDGYKLLIHPIVLGTGRRLFADGTTFGGLRLTDSVVTTKGVIIATYVPAPAETATPQRAGAATGGRA